MSLGILSSLTHTVIAGHQLVERVDALKGDVAMTGIFDLLGHAEKAELTWREEGGRRMNVCDGERHVAAESARTKRGRSHKLSSRSRGKKWESLPMI